MVIQDEQEVERERLAIMRVLSTSKLPVGSKVIARRIGEEYGIDLSERTVRYHLRLMDEKGLTSKVSERAGRMITPLGLEELDSALVSDRIGFVIDKIERLAYQTSFDPLTKQGAVPVNISFIPARRFGAALKAMAPVFHARLCVSDRIATAQEGEVIGGLMVPRAHVGLATICSILVNGVLLKAGIPMNSRFGGILQLRDGHPWRFTALIEYAGSSLDPSEVFIVSRMTSVSRASREGSGRILANFRELPAASLSQVEDIVASLSQAGIQGALSLGRVGKPVAEVPVGPNRVGLILLGGLNPVAAAVESGINVMNKAMSSIMDYSALISFYDLLSESSPEKSKRKL